MIYTVTFNPSIDYIVEVNSFQAGVLNRTASEIMYPGGKGINVSLVLSNLGHVSTALGFIGGFTGREISRLLSEESVTSDFIEVDEGISRINVKIRGEKETEINGRGPCVSATEYELFVSRLSKLEAEDYLVLAGAAASGMSSHAYADICKMMEKKGVHVVVDTTGNQLKNCLKFHPFLIKPNIHELGELFDTIIENKDEAWIYAEKLQNLGAKNVLVSLGAEGAILLDETGGHHFVKAPTGEVINTIGSGDSVVAGFIAGYIETCDMETAINMGVAAGSASAFNIGFCTREMVEELLNK